MVGDGRWTFARVRHEVDAAANKALIRRFYAEIDAGNIDAMDELVAEDYVDHNPPPFPGLPSGREGLKEAFRISGRRPRVATRSRIRSPRATRW